jgi:tetratricopeptide (TPR) repeat protein
LNARLPGFRSDPIQLDERRQLDNPSLGSIVLHRLANVQGYTFSMTTMNAPKLAQKDYEKGIESARKAKWPEAEARFRKAVAAYPKYAVCWEALGRALEIQKCLPDAQRAYEQSIHADPRFVTPHLRLMVLFGRERRWEETAGSAATVVQLDPYSYPIAYYFSGIANLNLKRAELAERDARAGLKVDPHGTVPRLNHLLGTLLMDRKAYAEALPYLKAYLQNQPAANDAEAVKGAIAHAEQMADMPGPDAPER